MVSHHRSGCTTEHTASHWLSSAPSLSQYLWMNIICRLQTNDKLSILFPFHAFKSKVFQSSCIPKAWIHEVRKQALFDPAPPILCQATLCCLTGKWAQNQRTEEYQKDQAAVGELAPDNSLASLWIAFPQLQSTTADSPAAYFRGSWDLSSGQQQRDQMIIAIGMILWSQLGERAWHSSAGRCEIQIWLLEKKGGEQPEQSYEDAQDLMKLLKDLWFSA